MTIKGKRSDALRKMSRAEAQDYNTGSIVDESFPPAAVRVVLGNYAREIDFTAFCRFFAPRLGNFRAWEELRQSQPPVSDEMKLVKEGMEAVEQVRLRLANLPPSIEAYANAACWKERKELFSTFARRLDVELDTAAAMLRASGREMEAHTDRRGRKDSSNRDWLLHDVARYLAETGLGKEAAAIAAADVLRAAGVDAPSEPRKARAIVRKCESLKIASN